MHAYKSNLQSPHTKLDMVLALSIENAPADGVTEHGTNLSDAKNPSNTPIQNMNHILLEIQPVVSMTHLLIHLYGNSKQKYWRTTQTRSLCNKRIIPVLVPGEAIGLPEVKEYKEQ